jgi:hypothetical protein
MPKREPFPHMNTAPEKRERESRPVIAGGDEISVSADSFANYAEKLHSIDRASRVVDVKIEKLHPPVGSRLPSDLQLLLVIVPSQGGAVLRVESAHPEELTEDDIRAIFGDVYVRAAGITIPAIQGPESILRRAELSSALDRLVRDRRRRVMKREIEKFIHDPGLRSLCEQALEAYPDKTLIPPEHADPFDPVHEGYELFEAFHRTLARPMSAINEVTIRISRLAALWRRLDAETQLRIRRELLATIP